jgi:hypothetical protein
MKEFGEFAKILEAGAAQAKVWLADDIAEIGKHQQVVAAELIGHEIPEWAPLAESTIAEKERLGYVGHVSPTDPLLRTGANRDSIAVEVDPIALEEATGSNRKEFLWMEMGTDSPHPIPPRPSLAIAAAGSLPFAGDKLVSTSVRMLTGNKLP